MAQDAGDAFDWLVPDDQNIEVAFRVSDLVIGLGRDKLPHLQDLLPFRASFRCDAHVGDGWIAVLLEDDVPRQQYIGGRINNPEVVSAAAALMAPPQCRSYSEVRAGMPAACFGPWRFTYVGPYVGQRLSSCRATPHDPATATPSLAQGVTRA